MNPSITTFTKGLYRAKKSVVSLLGGRADTLNPELRKYYEDSKDFVSMVEAGIIKDWRDFYMTADQMRDRYGRRK